MRATLVAYDPYGPWELEREALAEHGGALSVLDAETFMRAPVDAEILLNAFAARAPARILDAMPSLRCAVSYGVGIDWIDAAEAESRGVLLVNMPDANVEEVATHAFALLLACARRLRELDSSTRSGVFDWPRSRPLNRLRGRRLGLVAFGAIPRIVARYAQPFGLEVVAHDPFVEPAVMERHGVVSVSLEELFSSSHLVSVHVPSTAATRGLVGRGLLGLLPHGAIVVITSRGEVYDPSALREGLASGRVAAAGLDVFPREPLPENDPLTSLPNVLLTPHVAGYSEESIADLHTTAAEIIRCLGRGLTPPGVVNRVEPR